MKWFISSLSMFIVSVAMSAPPSWPVLPSPINPPTPVPTGVITNVQFGQFYFLTDDTEYLFKTVPEGIVSVVSKQTPFAVMGNFVDGTGKPDEERLYTSKYLYLIKPLKEGTVTIIATPKGVAVSKTDDIIVQVLTVGSPPSPTPSDPLAASVQSSFSSDTSSTKLADKSSLSAVYLVLSDPNKLNSIANAGGLFTVVKNSTTTVIGDKLSNVRKILGAELDKVLPSDATAVLTDQNKKDVSSLLLKFSKILDEVK